MATAEFLDANVILRFLTRDHPDPGARAAALFQRLEDGTAQCLTCEGVIVEVVFVLASRSLYNLPREEIRRKLLTIVDLRGLLLPLKEIFRRALDMYVSIPQLDFVDALSVAHSEHARIETIVSFDHDFDRVPGIHRREP